jgi:hypothetical protein
MYYATHTKITVNQQRLALTFMLYNLFSFYSLFDCKFLFIIVSRCSLCCFRSRKWTTCNYRRLERKKSYFNNKDRRTSERAMREWMNFKLLFHFLKTFGISIPCSIVEILFFLPFRLWLLLPFAARKCIIWFNNKK